MSRTSLLALSSLSLALLALPLSLGRPGLPMFLGQGEASHYLAALSVARDGDLVCDEGDMARLFPEFPATDHELTLRPGGEPRAPRFQVSWLYGALMAPAAVVLGMTGILTVNMLLTVGLLWLAVAHLLRHNREHEATLFGAGFVLASPLLFYAFRLQSETLCAAAVAVGLALCGWAELGPGETEEERADGGAASRRSSGLVTRSGVGLVLAGVAFAVAGYLRLELLLFVLPAMYLVRRQERRVGVLLAALAVALGVFVTVGVALGDEMLRGFDHSALVLDVDQPHAALERIEARSRPLLAAAGFDAAEFGHNLIDAFIGRHAGVLPYYPFASLAVFLLVVDRAPRQRSLLLIAALAVLIVRVGVLSHDWPGDAIVGSPALLGAYPALLFLTSRVRPGWLPVVGFAAAGLLIGPLLFGPLGLPVAGGETFVAARGTPMRFLPMESTLLESLTDRVDIELGDLRVSGRGDLTMIDGDQILIRGAATTDLWLDSATALSGLTLLVHDVAPTNRIELDLGRETQHVDFADVGISGETRRVDVASGPWRQVRRRDGTPRHVRPLRVSAERGAATLWRDPAGTDHFIGALVTVLGDPQVLAADLYRVEWLGPYVPNVVAVGDTFDVVVRLRQRGDAVWPSEGPARVRLSYRWRDRDGVMIEAEGHRTELRRPLPPNETLQMAQQVLAPVIPGCYVLELDPVYENVAWFSSQPGFEPYRAEVEVMVPMDEFAADVPSSIGSTTERDRRERAAQ